MGRDLRVCFVGDSYVAGVGDPEHLGWSGRLAARTHRASQPLTAYVLGVPRATSRDVARRWWDECTARLPDVCDGPVVVAVVVNDKTVEDGAVRLEAADSVGYPEQVLEGAQSAGWPTPVVGPPPICDAPQDERTAQPRSAAALRLARAGNPTWSDASDGRPAGRSGLRRARAASRPGTCARWSGARPSPAAHRASAPATG